MSRSWSPTRTTSPCKSRRSHSTHKRYRRLQRRRRPLGLQRLGAVVHDRRHRLDDSCERNRVPGRPRRSDLNEHVSRDRVPERHLHRLPEGRAVMGSQGWPTLDRFAPDPGRLSPPPAGETSDPEPRAPHRGSKSGMITRRRQWLVGAVAAAAFGLLTAGSLAYLTANSTNGSSGQASAGSVNQVTGLALAPAASPRPRTQMSR